MIDLSLKIDFLINLFHLIIDMNKIKIKGKIIIFL